MSRFIPSFHFVPAAEKLTDKFWKNAIDYCWHNTNLKSLLQDKDVDEIERWASGDIDMAPFKKMYKSIKKEFESNHPQFKGQNPEQDMQFIAQALLPAKINSVTALVQKIPFQIECTATDNFAFEKKQEDITFVVNKPKIEDDLQPFADQLNIGKVDIGKTKHSAEAYSDAPYGLDLTQPEELTVFVDLIYKLGAEAAYEAILQAIYSIKNIKQIKLLEIKDQIKYGVSCNKVFKSSMTGLPEFKYIYPGNVMVPYSDLPDFSDREADFEIEKVTPNELFNLFGDEICNEKTLDLLLNNKDGGYCIQNGLKNIQKGNYGSQKIELIYCEIKSIDGVGIVSNPKKSPYSYMQPLTYTDADQKCSKKVWAQNTYCAWWLKNTKHFFGIHKLGYAHRAKGMESYQGFSKSIYKSQEKSAVELSIPENKKAQIASIKMMYALIMSLPAGKYIDLQFLQSAAADLKESWGENVVEQLINLAFEKNIYIGSTKDLENNAAGNLKPFIDIPGGLKAEIGGYFQTMQHADAKISQFTGANDQLTGLKIEELVGLQDRAIDSSVNALYYINEAIESNYQKGFNILAWEVKQSIEDGGESKKFIENIIGNSQTDLIDRLEEIPLHSMGVTFNIFEPAKLKNNLDRQIAKLDAQGVLTSADEYMLEGIKNTKKKYAYTAARELQFRKRYDAEQQQRIAAQQEAIRMQGENMRAAEQEKAEGKNKNIYAQGQVQASLQQLVQQGVISEKQIEGFIKDRLQDKRNAAQKDRAISTLQAKTNLQAQNELTE